MDGDTQQNNRRTKGMKELKKHQLIRYTEALEKERDEYKANYEMLTIESET